MGVLYPPITVQQTVLEVSNFVNVSAHFSAVRHSNNLGRLFHELYRHNLSFKDGDLCNGLLLGVCRNQLSTYGRLLTLMGVRNCSRHFIVRFKLA